MKKLYIPPTLIAYCILSMIAIYFLLPKFNMILFPYNLVGILIAFSGFYLMGQARDLFKKHQTTVKIEKSNHLITDGVFSKSRNPMYGGMFVLIFGFSVFSTNIFSLVLPVIFIVLVRLIFLSKEEQLMFDTFGDDYLEYKKRVRRWL